MTEYEPEESRSLLQQSGDFTCAAIDDLNSLFPESIEEKNEMPPVRRESIASGKPPTSTDLPAGSRCAPVDNRFSSLFAASLLDGALVQPAVTAIIPAAKASFIMLTRF